MSTELTETRRNLAAILRWSSRLGLSEGICNHFSFAVGTDRFLVNPFGLHWSELKASHLLLVNYAGNVIDGSGKVELTALFIHAEIHRGVPQARCVLHTHMPFATALTTIERGRLEMASQNALRFYDDIAYDDDYQGLALDNAEGIRICRQANAKWVEDFDQRIDPNGRRYFWMVGNFVNFDKGEDNDEWAIANNYVAVVPCQFDLTAHSAIPSLNEDWDILLS